MKQSCVQCRASYEVTDEDKAFLAKVSPVIAGQRQDIPAPTHCPSCRQRRRITFRNDSHYYRNTCHLCGKPVISIYSSDKTVPVLCNGCYWSDRWDPLAYGVEFDPTKSFFEQYGAMRSRVPRITIFSTQSENSEYTVHSSKNRNCYMCSSAVNSEDVYYSDWPIRCRDSMDCLMSTDLELCYEAIDTHQSFNADWCELCMNVTDAYLCFDCHGSSTVVGCVSLRGAKNMILNKPATKEECEALVQKLKTDPAAHADFLQKFEELKLSLPKKYAWNLNAEGSTGDYLTNCKNARACFHCEYLEDCRHVYDATKIKDAMDLMRGSEGEMLYECKGIIDLKLSAFCNLTYQCDNLLYCDNCHGCSYCFGCFSLKKQKYCILNKQYTKEQYEELVPKIIDHMRRDGGGAMNPSPSVALGTGSASGSWGEFFPVTLSPFGYNETKAQEWYPMTKEEVTGNGWRWSEYEPPQVAAAKTLPAESIPPSIADVPDDILQWAIKSMGNGQLFRIIPQELEFYRKKGLPIPKLSWQERHLERKAHQNPCELFDRACAKCQKPVQTTYSPERPEIVYCEECYLKEVY
jgi:hypothetical protein